MKLLSAHLSFQPILKLEWPMCYSCKAFCVHLCETHPYSLFREARKEDWRSKQQAVKQDLLSQKLAAANAQEQAKMAMFHNMLPSGSKLTIPKRQ